MPRPKVDPRNRKRALEACIPCKSSKKKCDGARPCTTCTRNRKTDVCRFASNTEGNNAPQSHQSKPQLDRRSTTSVRSVAPEEPVPDNTSNTPGQMLWTSRGLRVFVGNSASLSFLHLLRNMFVKFSGHSAFTADSGSSFMLERSSDPATPAAMVCEHPYEELVDLLDTAFAATSGIFGSSLKDSLLQVFQDGDWNKEPTVLCAAAHAALALGAQCRAASDEDLRCAAGHAATAQRIASENMLTDIDMHLVWAYLLISHYLLGACRRNAAFICIGIAARTAAALGLHDHTTYISTSSDENKSMLQTWQSVRVLDQLVSALLGRPPATGDMGSLGVEANEEASFNPKQHRDMALDAMCKVCSITDKIVRRFYKEDAFSIHGANMFLESLKRWSTSLPHILRSQPVKSSFTLTDQEATCGNLHVACSYYYAVILATRRPLISHLVSRLTEANSPEDLPRSSVDIDSQQDEEHARLAKTCVESALLLLQTCRDVYNTNMLFANTCLLKAWIFAAAMIVAFAMFSKDNSDPELEDGYAAANIVLVYLSAQSPQAKQYADILHSIFNALQDHRRKVQKTSPLVCKIFEISPFYSTQSLPAGLPYEGTTDDIAKDPGSVGAISQDPFGDGHSISFDTLDSVATQVWDEFLLGQYMGSF